MASRRDELNAYTFAKRRMVAAFLAPSPTGSDEGAPRPLRAVLPSMIAGALILAGFGAVGMFRPTAPTGWDRPGANVIVGKKSTTRYVVLTTGRGENSKTLLHPVLNLASARLLLTPQSDGVVQVADDILDAGKPPRGPLLGIPYAPDRLPEDKDAGTAKRWAVCVQPGGSGNTVQKAAFVLAERDNGLMEGANRLTEGQVLYVRGQDRTRYLVDAHGTKYRIDETPADLGHLTGALVGSAQPQPVTDDWLATLHDGSPIAFPPISATPAPRRTSRDGSPRGRTGSGRCCAPGTGGHRVLRRPRRKGPAGLRVHRLAADQLPADRRPRPERRGARRRPPGLRARPRTLHRPGRALAAHRADRVNSTEAGGSGRDTVCNVLRKADGNGVTTLSTWAGTSYPAAVGAGGTGTYVTPGSGLLYTQVRGRQTSPDGSLFLVTDTGLRYAVQANGDSDAERSGIGTGSTANGPDGRPEPSEAQIRLGYEKVAPVLVPIEWSDFLSKGPRLDTNSARRPQGS